MQIQIEINPTREEPLITIEVEKITERIDRLCKIISECTFDKLMAYKNKEIFLIKSEDIVRVFTEKGKVKLKLENDLLDLKLRLYELEDYLPKNKFVKISQSEIINIDWVEKLDLSIYGSIKVCLKNNDITYTSRRYIPIIKNFLEINGGKYNE